ncbi:MAG: ABC transporter ATP-binding protein [Kiritimatiellaeota bacterium]|nr:ABC transporter ATP-binding protein [Kiritimatiellota bacterium]
MLSSTAIDVEGLTRDFGTRRALEAVSLSVAPGERVMLLGENGAGKTTLMRILACFYPPTAGHVRVGGYDVFTHSLDARAAIGYLPESVPLYEELTVRETLRFHGRIRAMSGKPLYLRILEVLEGCGLAEERHTPIRRLSRGQRVRVAVAATLLHRPQVLLLDDPFAAIDAESRAALLSILRDQCRASTLVVSTHIPDLLAPLATRAITLSHGRIANDSGAPIGTLGTTASEAEPASLSSLSPTPHDTPRGVP